MDHAFFNKNEKTEVTVMKTAPLLSAQNGTEGRKTAGEQQRHDINDKARERIRPYTAGFAGGEIDHIDRSISQEGKDHE